MRGRRSVGLLAALALLLCLAAASGPAFAAPASEQEPETTLPGCGIRYPGGYDPNTVGVVEGGVSDVVLPDHGPVSFRLSVDRETYTVFVAPAWHVEQIGLRVAGGERVRVKGSKSLGEDGNLYLVVREISWPATGKSFTLRDAAGKPAWSGCGPRGCGKHRGAR